MRKLYRITLCLLLAFFSASLAMADDDTDAAIAPAPIPLSPKTTHDDQTNKEMAAITAKIEQLALNLDNLHQDLQHLNQPQPQPRPHVKNVWLKNNILNAVNTLLLLISIVMSIILLKKYSQFKNQNVLPPVTQVTEPKSAPMSMIL